MGFAGGLGGWACYPPGGPSHTVILVGLTRTLPMPCRRPPVPSCATEVVMVSLDVASAEDAAAVSLGRVAGGFSEGCPAAEADSVQVLGRCVVLWKAIDICNLSVNECINICSSHWIRRVTSTRHVMYISWILLTPSDTTYNSSQGQIWLLRIFIWAGIIPFCSKSAATVFKNRNCRQHCSV